MSESGKVRPCECRGCFNVTDQGRFCWTCWSSRKDRGVCSKHQEAREAYFNSLGTPISLRDDPEDAVYGSGMGEQDEPSWHVGREVGR